ncbi:hypothetical protein LTR08_009201 [Meristemomyces frigidus]|nr:hypothetical protein LTR08_009201 [Meristemomyces frigidus]
MHARLFNKDEELGKRDDDFKPKRSPTASALMKPWQWRKRRLFTIAAAVLMLYVFVHNLPNDLGPVDERAGRALRPGHTVIAPDIQTSQQEPRGPPPGYSGGQDGEAVRHNYDGPIKFYKLATSLHGISRTMGSRPQNRNVLFAVSSLRSAANLMPMACEMAKWDRNYVHMAFLGRDPLPLDDILEVNGVSKKDCAVYLHDARGDYSEYSSEQRAEISVAGAMKHINDFMHPQAMIMDDSMAEDTFFTRAMRGKARELGRALIEVPSGRYEEFFWMTRLDSGSLSNWFEPVIDVLIHAPTDSSGGLMRLVRSLQSADYAGLKVPRLTIELPTHIERFAQRFLQELEWPPISDPSPVKQSTLTLRHRIPSSRLSSEQASVRLLESFYPVVTEHNHVLVLSPQAELSPQYLQYLHYVVLEYKYSTYPSPSSEELLGVSLDIPSTFLNGSGSFVPPVTAEMQARQYLDKAEYDQAVATPFLYQAPSATASLIFGNKWVTLHNFLSNRLAASHAGKAEKTTKLVSETEPAWLEYLLELMKARGWSMLHPGTSFVTIHDELSQIPEEFTREKSTGKKDAAILEQPEHAEEEAFLTASDPPDIVSHVERQPRDTQPLHEFLPFRGDLPELTQLPYMYNTGDLINATRAAELKDDYITLFRHQIGGCDHPQAARKRVVHELDTNDLFCLPGVEIQFDLEAADEEAIALAVIQETSGPAGHDDGEEEEVTAVEEEVQGSAVARAGG